MDRAAKVAKWRRFDAGMATVRDQVENIDPAALPDAVITTLEALYALWEVWKDVRTNKVADNAVSGNAAGETTAALVFVRGANTHKKYVEFGDFTDTYASHFHAHYGCWRWQPYDDPTSDYSRRNGWYDAHVARREVLPPLENASDWLRVQPELAI